jgi:hypothetical protein
MQNYLHVVGVPMQQGSRFPSKWVVGLRLRLCLQKKDGFSGPELGVVEQGKVRTHGNQSSPSEERLRGTLGVESEKQGQVPYSVSLLGMSEILLDSKGSNYYLQTYYNSYSACPIDVRTG